MEEREALDRLKSSDISGLETLVRHHHARAVGAAYLITRDKALAEDVAQSAFVRAYERTGGFDAGRPFGPWFMKIVVNDAIKAASRRGRTTSREVNGADEALARLADPATGPHEQAEAAEVKRRVWRALEELPPIQRAAIVQRYYLGMSEAEMSEGGQSPQGTIKRRLHDARKSLSKLLRPQFRARNIPGSPTAPSSVGDPSGSSQGRQDHA